MALRDRLMPWWYVVILVATIVAPGFYATLKAGNTMTSHIRHIHKFSIAVAKHF